MHHLPQNWGVSVTCLLSSKLSDSGRQLEHRGTRAGCWETRLHTCRELGRLHLPQQAACRGQKCPPTAASTPAQPGSPGNGDNQKGGQAQQELKEDVGSLQKPLAGLPILPQGHTRVPGPQVQKGRDSWFEPKHMALSLWPQRLRNIRAQ